MGVAIVLHQDDLAGTGTVPDHSTVMAVLGLDPRISPATHVFADCSRKNPWMPTIVGFTG